MNYYDVNAINASSIKKGAVSMLHMHHAMTGQGTQTSAILRGSKLHMAVLEPEKLQSLQICDNFRTKEYKELCELHGKENVVKAAELQELKEISSIVRKNPIVKELGLLTGGEAEKEIYWKGQIGEYGFDAKAKIDYLSDKFIVEYKTTNNLANFASAAARMHYHLQLAWYQKAARLARQHNAEMFVVVQESLAPFDVAVFKVDGIMLEDWYFQCVQIVKQYLSGDRSGAYPELMSFELPAWADNSDDIFDLVEGE